MVDRILGPSRRGRLVRHHDARLADKDSGPLQAADRSGVRADDAVAHDDAVGPSAVVVEADRNVDLRSGREVVLVFVGDEPASAYGRTSIV